MGIDPKSIQTDFTLELDQEKITVADFGRAVESFFGLVKEVSREVYPKKDASSWLVRVYPGSAGIGVFADRDVFGRNEVEAIKATISQGIVSIDSGDRPEHFSDKALGYVKAIGHLSGADSNKQIRMWYGREASAPMKGTLAIQISKFLEPAYEADGSIDGFLEKLNAHGRFEFVVYEVLSNRAVTCIVEERMLDIARMVFRQRVEVLGRVKYRRDGKPVSVRAKDIVAFPSKDEIPSLDEIRRLLSES